MAKVFVTRKIPQAGLDLLKGVDFSVWEEDRVIPREVLLERVKGVDAVLSLLTDKIDGEVMDAAGIPSPDAEGRGPDPKASGLKIVSNYAVGFDNVDVPAATQRKIYVTNTPGVLTEAVAEHTFALLLAAARRIPESDQFIRAGKYKGWGPLLLLGTEVKDKVLGIVGLGRIGSRVAEMANKGMGMKIIYHDPKQDPEFEKEFSAVYKANLDDLLKEADFVSIHVPLLPSTRHLINADKLKLMKKTAYLINTSRGPIVDEAALVEALKSGTIAGAALDVFENEPNLAPGLAELPNLVLTPHTASATFEARGAMAVLAAQAILDVLAGKPPQNLVNAVLAEGSVAIRSGECPPSA
ncbi:MAG: D-glycerate dehydrogenase [candidate division WWE3 bacterium]|nr:D-glycerate dehydrogenase [candidate division WWE3 bacterium]